jgi:uncharacterized membrane protein YkvA (DUF1232 family)
LRARFLSIRRTFIAAATEIYALYLALRDPHATPVSRLVAIMFALYVIFPIDLIPEPLPLIGIADDLIAFPLAYFVISRMLPGTLLEAAHRRAHESRAGERLWRAFLIALGLLSIIWIIATVGLGITIWRALR